MYVVGTHLKHLSEAILMSTTTYVFMVNLEKYQYFSVEKTTTTKNNNKKHLIWSCDWLV